MKAAGSHTSHPSAARIHLLALAAIFGAAIMWSLNGVLIKYISGDAAAPGVPPLTTAAYRSLIGGLVLLPLAWPQRRTLQSVSPRWPVLSILAFTLMSACFVAATAKIAAASAILLQYTSPVWVFLLAPLILNERVRAHDWLVLAIAMVGLGVVFLGQRADLPGLTLALFSGLGYGALTVFLRRLRTVHPLVVTAGNALGSGFLLVCLLPFFATFRVSLSEAAWLLLMGFVQFALPYVLFAWGLQHVEATRAALIVLLETILNPLWTFLILGENPPAPTIYGAPLILGAVLLKIVLDRRAVRPLQPARVQL